MDEMQLLSIISMSKLASAFAVADAGVPYPEKMAGTQSKNRGEKNAATGCPGPRCERNF